MGVTTGIGHALWHGECASVTPHLFGPLRMMLRRSGITIPLRGHVSTLGHLPHPTATIMAAILDGVLQTLCHVSHACRAQVHHGLPEVLFTLPSGGGVLLRPLGLTLTLWASLRTGSMIGASSWFTLLELRLLIRAIGLREILGAILIRSRLLRR